MDMGNFQSEKEVLLAEGTSFVVQSVEDVQDNYGNQIKLITLQCQDMAGSKLGFALSYLCMFLFKPYSLMK